MYVKLFKDILNSTVWMMPDHILRVWLTLLLLCDAEGDVVGCSLPGLAKEAGVTLEEAIEAVEKLQQPDEYSQSKEFEGRRILQIGEGGTPAWHVINYVKYRTMRNQEARKAYMRDYMRKYRQAHKPTPLASVNSVSSGKPQEEEEAEGVGIVLPTSKTLTIRDGVPIGTQKDDSDESSVVIPKKRKRRKPIYDSRFEMWWSEFSKIHPRGGGSKEKAYQAWETTDHPLVEEMIKIWTRQRKPGGAFAGENPIGLCDGQGYINQEQWKRQPPQPDPASFPVEGLPMFSNSREAALAAQKEVDNGRGAQESDGEDQQGTGKAGEPGLEPWRGDALPPDDDDIPFA
jgi:hypothetical protein